MKSAVTLRRGVSIPGAILLSLVMASQALAAFWTTPEQLTSTGIAFAESIGTVGGSTALALYIEHDPDMPDVGFSYRLKLRRSTDSGGSWGPPMLLSNNGLNADIATSGSAVDVIYDGINNNRIRYRRSVDGGLTFEPAVRLSPRNKSARNPSVARGPDGVVVVSWENPNTNVVWVRVSTNSGDSWGAPIAVADVAEDMGTEVAVGDGVIYVAYVDDDGFDNLRVRRSMDDGASWSGPIVITDDMYATFEQFDITAAGSEAYVAYSFENAAGKSDVKYRRTTNGGGDWSAQAALAPSRWHSSEPAISLQGGVVRAVFTRNVMFNTSVYYRQSSNSTTWSSSELVAEDSYEASVGHAGNSIAVFRSGHAAGTDVFAAHRE